MEKYRKTKMIRKPKPLISTGPFQIGDRVIVADFRTKHEHCPGGNGIIVADCTKEKMYTVQLEYNRDMYLIHQVYIRRINI